MPGPAPVAAGSVERNFVKAHVEGDLDCPNLGKKSQNLPFHRAENIGRYRLMIAQAVNCYLLRDADNGLVHNERGEEDRSADVYNSPESLSAPGSFISMATADEASRNIRFPTSRP